MWVTSYTKVAHTENYDLGRSLNANLNRSRHNIFAILRILNVIEDLNISALRHLTTCPTKMLTPVADHVVFACPGTSPDV